VADESKPYVGYRSAGRRPARNNDRESAANAPLSLIRGWAAGTAGLPGDIESLVRMLPFVERKESVLPTSDFYAEWLPGRSLNETPTGKAATGAGSLAGGVGAGTAARGIRQAGGALNRVAEAAVRNAAVPRTLNPQAGVIKMPGGNWLSGSVEDSLYGLKTQPIISGERMNELSGRDLFSEYRKAYDADPTVGLHAWTSKTHPDVYGQLLHPEELAMNTWIDKALTKYVKNDMATPGDPVRALAERGVLHVDPQQLDTMAHFAPRRREFAGGEAMGNSPLAKAWEDSADTAIEIDTAGQLLKPRVGGYTIPALDANPWLAKVPPETPVNKFSVQASPTNGMDTLGFSHLIDELRNATNPDSGLPRELLLKYDALPKVTVPQAVERVAKINAWRAAQKVEADLARANNAATVLHKEYPEQGFKWVELAAKERTPEIEKNLADALKYEGETMGHCVGGYCPDVLEGKSRIYSLRDKKGVPHVTVEVGPNQHLDYNRWFARQSDEMKNEIARRRVEAPGYDVYETPEYLSERSSQPARIIQIKGKANRAPNEEYLPYVQDFVRSGQWSDVGDLSNTGLKKLADLGDEPLIQSARQKYGDFITNSEWDELMGGQGLKDKPGPEQGFAAGGLVSAYNPDEVDSLAAQLAQEFAVA
jgi:hypothetical protein